MRSAGLARAPDSETWEYALKHGLAIVSKDSDFHQRRFLSSTAPKVIWIRLGNCTTRQIDALVRAESAAIRNFLADPETVFLALG